MTYEVSKEVMNEVIKEFAKTAKKLKGDLVVFTSRLEDEYVIRDIKDFEKLKIKNGDMVEATVYVDDDDELFEEFRLGNGKDDQVVRDKVLDRKK
ncbi:MULTISPECIES: hypothetical protein [Fusobacterium]|jgi:hypothetical protein|uniref:Uncharacterized protein n=1 Tax=Fusobacterium ulcerans TaxID=861 RepID=A0AAX1TMZ4_9FUSO|nr:MULTISPECIES: hypothetical protein [Fusobacterium]AVQ28893.1 hypothetical protein C4N20_12640 [Fusobacterium ulcerans]EFS26377.1 hypothetical protein FUAG_01892 [Fusobacterium ulcerans ATCC 49185]MCB8563811.1 hypothetical protein [Fusobacterium ulcerans]MCB8648349.1 hypothetical protein [Fusobacterium ulcerans]MDH6456804.1 hypothetical protein [Fusobacterium sp. PH5-7]